MGIEFCLMAAASYFLIATLFMCLVEAKYIRGPWSMLRRPFHADHPYGKRYYPAYMIHNDNGLGYKELCKAFYNMVKLGKRSKRSADPQEECLASLFESYQDLENIKNMCLYDQEEDCLSAQEEIAKNILETMNQCYSSTAETNGNGSIMQSAPLVYRVI